MTAGPISQGLQPPSLTLIGAGLLGVKGPVTFATAGQLLEAGQAVFSSQADVTINLHEVTSVDSAGLALLLEWLRQARADRRAVRFVGMPEKLLAIARLSGVEALLTGGYSPAGAASLVSPAPDSSGSDSSVPDSSR